MRASLQSLASIIPCKGALVEEHDLTKPARVGVRVSFSHAIFPGRMKPGHFLKLCWRSKAVQQGYLFLTMSDLCLQMSWITLFQKFQIGFEQMIICIWIKRIFACWKGEMVRSLSPRRRRALPLRSNFRRSSHTRRRRSPPSGRSRSSSLSTEIRKIHEIHWLPSTGKVFALPVCSQKTVPAKMHKDEYFWSTIINL